MAFEAGEDGPFPSDLERCVASALLMLADSSPRRSDGSCSSESLESTGFYDPKSISGTWMEEASIDEESSSSGAQRLAVEEFMSRIKELKLKMVRKKRSKTVVISEVTKSQSSNSAIPASFQSVSELATTTTISTSFSSSSSAQTYSNESRAKIRLRNSIPTDLGKRSNAILNILSIKSASELKIRQLLGDSPSTSKALRILLKLDEVKRIGAGGRADPYIYMIP